MASTSYGACRMILVLCLSLGSGTVKVQNLYRTEPPNPIYTHWELHGHSTQCPVKEPLRHITNSKYNSPQKPTDTPSPRITVPAHKSKPPHSAEPSNIYTTEFTHTHSKERENYIKTLHSADNKSSYSEVTMRMGSDDETETLQISLETNETLCQHHVSAAFTSLPLTASAKWSCDGTDHLPPGILLANISTRGCDQGITLRVNTNHQICEMVSPEMILSLRGHQKSWYPKKELEWHFNACRPQEPDLNIQCNNLLNALDESCASVPLLLNEKTHGLECSSEAVKMVVKLFNTPDNTSIKVFTPSPLTERVHLTFESSLTQDSRNRTTNTWNLHFPTINLGMEVRKTAWHQLSKNHVHYQATLVNLVNHTSIRFISKEVEHLLKENKETESKYFPDLQQELTEKKQSSARFQQWGTGKAHRVKEIQQNIVSDLFSMTTNMTVDVTDHGEQLIDIRQKSSLPFCPYLDWDLRQIFNFSSKFSGWEYVVSHWSWGNMVVEAQWGPSLLQYYHKIFAFNIDQKKVLPSTHILLDFKDYKDFRIKLKFPTLGESVVFVCQTDHGHHLLKVETVDEFNPNNSSTLVAIEATQVGGDVKITWSLQDGKPIPFLDILMAWNHEDLCGPTATYRILDKFIADMFGYFQLMLLPEIMSVLSPLAEVKEVMDLFAAIQQAKGKGSWLAFLMSVGQRLGVVEPHVEVSCLILKTAKVRSIVHTLMSVADGVLGCDLKCTHPTQLGYLMDHLATALRHWWPSCSLS